MAGGMMPSYISLLFYRHLQFASFRAQGVASATKQTFAVVGKELRVESHSHEACMRVCVAS